LLPSWYTSKDWVSPNCNLSSLSNRTLALKVETPETLTLSKFVCPSTSKSPFASILFANVETPTMFKPPPSTLIPPALTSTPVLAVTIPSESIFVTSS